MHCSVLPLLKKEKQLFNGLFIEFIRIILYNYLAFEKMNQIHGG